MTFPICVVAQEKPAVLELVLQQNEVPIGIQLRLLALYGDGSLEIDIVCH
jgi:hypothetical protein